MEVLCTLQVEIVSGLKFDYKRENNFKILCRSILISPSNELKEAVVGRHWQFLTTIILVRPRRW